LTPSFLSCEFGKSATGGTFDGVVIPSDIKPFYRGAKITAIGSISIKKIVGLMTMNDSIDVKALEVLI
jgi:hypothetical protein